MQRSVRGRYTAPVEISSLGNGDLDVRNNHALRVTNPAGTSVFYVTLDTSPSCRDTQRIPQPVSLSCSSGGGGTSIFSGGNRDYFCSLSSDPNCRCDRDRRYCCNANPNSCRGSECCSACSRDDEVRGLCDLCDASLRNCMRGGTAGTGAKYSCNPARDPDCVCVGGGTNFCCDYSSRCVGSSCCRPCSSPGADCQCESGTGSRYCVIVDNASANLATSTIEAKAQRTMLDSCLRLSSTLLELWTPAGERRATTTYDPSRVQTELRDFFETVRCTRFDQDIQVCNIWYNYIHSCRTWVPKIFMFKLSMIDDFRIISTTTTMEIVSLLRQARSLSEPVPQCRLKRVSSPSSMETL